jgi:hypothetical protein
MSLLRLLEEGAFEEDPEDPEFEEGADEDFNEGKSYNR